MKDLTVIQSSREVIAHKLLTALEGGRQVAILATKSDLAMLIEALTKLTLRRQTSGRKI